MAGSRKTALKKATKSAAKKKLYIQQNDAADAVDEQLARYRSMRDFNITSEPSGKDSDSTSVEGLPFCIQKHAASHLHYDFRLGWNGVLKSWAIAKGPSYFTGDKRLAVQVEDHPLEYGGFEGIIPKGQYGGGTVMLWDQGTWDPQPGYTDVNAGLRDGSLKFILHGAKLQGKWALIRMGGKWAKEKKPNWLLIKEHDEFERKQDETPITESEPDSVVTGRSIEEIANSGDHVWNSKDTRSGEKAWFRKEPTKGATKRIPSSFQQRLKEIPKEKQPEFLPPQLASMKEVPPSGVGWLHELKLDGYRIQARKDGDRVQMLTRKGLDWTHRMQTTANEIAKLAVDQATLDGELVVLKPNGTTSFADLQISLQEGAQHTVTYFAFDLLHLEGKNTRDLPLKERKALLSDLLVDINQDLLRLSEHIETEDARALLHKACELQAEGLLSKNANGRYISGRSSDWIKTKCLHEQEFVIGGYTLPSNDIRGVGALLLGYYDRGKLIYAGRAGTGFNHKTHKLVRDCLEELAQEKSPFASLPGDARKDALWVRPEMVAQVRFATWTADNLIRQAAFLGLREDKPAKEVVREEPDTSIGPKRARGRHLHSPQGEVEVPSRKTTEKKDVEGNEHASIRLTHPEKILDEASGMTKQILADYYWAIAEWMLPQIEGRPVSLVRCPEGSGKPCFFQKHVNSMLPKGIGSVDIADKKGKVEPYITLNTVEALAGLAQLGVLEVHPWGSRNEDLEHPDRLIFDLDPDEELDWSEIVDAAFELRRGLKKLKIESFVKTTGGKGLHIIAPIKAEHTWPEVKEFARKFALVMEKNAPQRYLTKMTKAARRGKIYLDYLRNERGATSVAAYSPRARIGAPVSMPLLWTELQKSTERPVFRVAELAEWKSRLKQDPWKDLSKIKQQLQLGLVD
ncbi:DNA ligase D [Edaphobacter albus]|uniref:DNA ligase D n=1 Tax=Edaphobacter sp. 4G125 TaxID=2763071 RepID=UPI0016470AFF|nr:DNA ligase D [Edaphobacter sp. 4G125]QNI38587.1 DNA ligase D [Edaphobacter sp. 4G125]